MDHISGRSSSEEPFVYRTTVRLRGRSMAKLKASAPVVPIDGGPPCPRCGRLMQRYMQRYGGDKEAARHRYWNHCRPCKEDPWLGACPNSRCSILSESDSSLSYEQVFSPLEYRSDTAAAAECAGLRAERPCLAVYR